MCQGVTYYLTVWCLEINKDLEDLEDQGRAGTTKAGLDLEGLACVRHKEDLVDSKDLAALVDMDSSKDPEDPVDLDNKDLEDPADPAATDSKGSKDNEDSKALDLASNNAQPKTLAHTG
ncbi:hypothetical protein IWW41_000009 [Coemansia sp. RSA 2522]|nr:hypothetical protein IWW41_000009 [Coemansia sp. RSA 2522]